MNGEINTNAGAHKHIRVLIADDSAALRSALGELLERLPHVELVGAAEDGDHALTLVGSLRPDLVLMDMKMPRPRITLRLRLCGPVEKLRDARDDFQDQLPALDGVTSMKLAALFGETVENEEEEPLLRVHAKTSSEGEA